MPDAVTIKLEGGKEIHRALMRMEAKVARKITKRALRAGTKVIRDQAVANAPSDTGRMKKAMIVRAARKRKRGEASFNVMFDTKKYPELITRTAGGKRFFYPAVVEYGTATRPAKAFMRRAWDSRKMDALRVIMRAFRGGLDDAARGIGPRRDPTTGQFT